MNICRFGVKKFALFSPPYGIYKLFFFKDGSSQPKIPQKTVTNPNTSTNTSKPAKRPKDNRNFVQRMKESDRTMIIFYGSQTGTGEEFSYRISQNARRYGIKSLVVNPEDIDYEEMVNMREELDVNNNKNITIIMCLATYGEGDPTDNFQEMYDFLVNQAHLNEKDMLKDINYAIFALGNKTYEQFCQVGRKVDQVLQKNYQGNRLINVGLGDDNENIEEDFTRWEEELWQKIVEAYDIDISKISQENQNIYQLVPGIDQSTEKYYQGEPYRLNSYKNQRKPFIANKNPYLATITKTESSILPSKRKNCNRNYMHIEFDLGESALRYEAGDHLATLCPNSDFLVDKILKLLDLTDKANEIISLKAVDEEAPKQHPFPCPTNWRSVFKYYLDINVPPRANVLKSLVQFCSNQEEKNLMDELSKIGSTSYERDVVNARRSIVHILEDFPSCKPSAELIAQVLPRLQPRYYSISSSYRIDNKIVSICCVEVDYQSSKSETNNYQSRRIKGVATGHLASLKVGDKVPIWVRRSQFKLPFKTSFPVMMIGPGTGIAPYRGFLQERRWSRLKGKEVGFTCLFTGFRTKNADYIYEAELDHFEKEGTLDENHVAFSRDDPTGKKVYVQHLIKKEKKLVWELIQADCYIYVCGDASGMARDVQEALLEILEEKMGKGRSSAENYLKKMTNRGRYLLDVWS